MRARAGGWMTMVMWLVGGITVAGAVEPYCEESLTLPVESIPEHAAGEASWDRASFLLARADCQRQAAAAREQLAREHGVNASALSDIDSLRRLEQEQVRAREQRDAEFRRSEEEQRRAEDIHRAADAAGAEQRAAAEALMRQQSATLRGLGVDVSGLDADEDGDEGLSEEDEDAEYDAIELRMYQQMVDRGVAPQCRGQTGAALIECVDEVLDAEEDE